MMDFKAGRSGCGSHFIGTSAIKPAIRTSPRGYIYLLRLVAGVENKSIFEVSNRSRIWPGIHAIKDCGKFAEVSEPEGFVFGMSYCFA